MSLRIGIDVGGTNTDAVIMRGNEVTVWVKRPTTADVTSGIIEVLHAVLETAGSPVDEVASVMIGTTHFTNAVVQRKGLTPAAAIRLGLPATESLPPMVDWPEDLRRALGEHVYLAHGGIEFDGRPISPLDSSEITKIARDIRMNDVQNIAVSAVFSPIRPQIEEEVVALLQSELPGAHITASSSIGRTGLLERESAAILNAALHELGERIVDAFTGAIAESGIHAPLYFTQNDGTLMSAEFAKRFPVLTIASGPTNSMRGSAFLSGLSEAIVVDVGGTTTDIGALYHGFPREASLAVDIGGVRTNFRMPDILSIGLGGGSLVREGPLRVGPESVGFRLLSEARVFGGTTLTATDLAVASGSVTVGDPERVRDLDPELVQQGIGAINADISSAVERMLLSPEPIPVIVVGGGSILIGEKVAGLTTVKPEHFEVANAVGAAIAQISGEVDRVYALSDTSRDQALREARDEAAQRAVEAGADPATVEIVDVEDVPLAYLPGNATRIRVKAVGGLSHG